MTGYFESQTPQMGGRKMRWRNLRRIAIALGENCDRLRRGVAHRWRAGAPRHRHNLRLLTKCTNCETPFPIASDWVKGECPVFCNYV